MPVPTQITDLSQVAASNFPAGSDSPANLDDVQRAQSSFIALLRDGKGLSAPVTLASAATTDIGGQNSIFVEISGTTGITSLGTNYNGPRFLRFTGILPITHNATTLNLPGAANITTAAGDTAIAYPNQALNGWNVVSYNRASGITPIDGAKQGFRLTLTSGTPVTTADVTGATTIYCTPYSGKYIDLYDGSSWNRRSSTEFSLALGTLTASLPHDVFCYDNAGVPTLEFLAWTNTSTRATALVYQDGVLSKSGALTRRYLGTFYTTSTTTTADSAANRFLFNYYHRKPRFLDKKEATASWTYSTATWRQANGSTANQVNFLIGVVEDEVEATVTASGICSNTFRGSVGVGLNSVTTPTGFYASMKSTSAGSITELMWTPSFKGIPALGLNYFSWLEWAESGGTNTWYGVFSSSTQQSQSGISARIMA